MSKLDAGVVAGAGAGAGAESVASSVAGVVVVAGVVAGGVVVDMMLVKLGCFGTRLIEPSFLT